MRANSSKDFNKIIKNALDMANDLCYDEQCKAAIRNAKNETQIENIMISARRRRYD